MVLTWVFRKGGAQALVAALCALSPPMAEGVTLCPSALGRLQQAVRLAARSSRPLSPRIREEQETPRIPLLETSASLTEMLSDRWAGPRVPVPRLRSFDDYQALQDLSLIPQTGESRTVRRRLARGILEEATHHSPMDFFAQERFLAALATLHNVGTPRDLAALSALSPRWAERFAGTLALVARRVERRAGEQTTASPEQVLAFARAVFRDTRETDPEIGFHTTHSARVADLTVRMVRRYREQKGRSPLDSSEEQRLRIAVEVHDLGKALWPRSLVRKNHRLQPREVRSLLRAVERAEARGTLAPEETIRARETLKRLNLEIDRNGKLPPLQPGDTGVLKRLRALGILSEPQFRELQAEAIILSPEERAMVNKHVNAYRILLILRPQGLEAALAQLHHETMDGSGYPFRLDRRDLGRSALGELCRMVTVADIYDAYTQPRPNSPAAASPEQGLEALQTRFASKVDARFVELLSEVIREGAYVPAPVDDPFLN